MFAILQSRLVIFLAALFVTSCSKQQSADEDIAALKALEVQRLEALVAANIDVASKLHADDFQLVTPFGEIVSKERYLGNISDGTLDYIVWRPLEIAVRFYGDVAAIRYQDSEFVVEAGGMPHLSGLLVHTNIYEKRGDNWIIVWSHASGGELPIGTE
jgi:hypothetical protein